jgi:hypothetical protein
MAAGWTLRMERPLWTSSDNRLSDRHGREAAVVTRPRKVSFGSTCEDRQASCRVRFTADSGSLDGALNAAASMSDSGHEITMQMSCVWTSAVSFVDLRLITRRCTLAADRCPCWPVWRRLRRTNEPCRLCQPFSRNTAKSLSSFLACRVPTRMASANVARLADEHRWALWLCHGARSSCRRHHRTP